LIIALPAIAQRLDFFWDNKILFFTVTDFYILLYHFFETEYSQLQPTLASVEQFYFGTQFHLKFYQKPLGA